MSQILHSKTNNRYDLTPQKFVSPVSVAWDRNIFNTAYNIDQGVRLGKTIKKVLWSAYITMTS